MIKQVGMALNHKSVGLDYMLGINSVWKGGEALNRLSRDAVDTPSLERVQGQVGWSSDEPGVMKSVPAYSGWAHFGTLPTQTIL